MKNYYQILQVDPSAEQEVIEAAFKRLASKYHPDKNRSPDATSNMQKLNEAYETLRDVNKRKQYDNGSRAREEPPKQEPKYRAPKQPPSSPRESPKATPPNTPPRRGKRAKPRQPDKIHSPYTYSPPLKTETKSGGMYIKLFGTEYHITNDQWENIGLVVAGILFIFLILFMVFLYYYSKSST